MWASPHNSSKHAIRAGDEKKGRPDRKREIMKGSVQRLLRFLALVTIMGMSGCADSKERKVPEELIGIWETSEPQYADSTIELTPREIIFSNPEIGRRVNRIMEIKRSPAGRKTLYDIHYEDDQRLDYTLSLYHLRINEEGILQFRFKEELVWRRRGPT
jgi:hypothetical protein